MTRRRTCSCGRPVHAKGRCRSCYRAVQKSRSAGSVVAGTRPPENGSSDLRVCTESEHLPSAITPTWENGTLRRGDEFQVPGIVCPDCKRVAAFGWCLSDRHPTFDDRGYLVRMTPRARGDA